MNGKFVSAHDVEWTTLEWGKLGWLSRAPDTGSEQITMVLVHLEPGYGHNFHRHHQQEEVVHLLSGELEQWIDHEKRTLRSGDVAFVKRGVVHASFNTGRDTATFIAVLSPSVGDGGYESEELGDQAPWNDIRKGA